MIALTAALGAALAASPPLPDIASQLPPTWPPPGWPTSVQLPGQPANTTAPAAAALDKWIEVFPHVRINRALKAVEFDSNVAWDFHNADTPRTELELLVCLPMRDKEHESLLLSQAKGAHVHAALLMVGFEPGTPGKFDFSGENGDKVARIPPTGPEVAVTFCYLKNGKETVDDAMKWVADDPSGSQPPRFVFAGSSVGQMRNEQGDRVNVYNADELGCLIGLCTFGGETIGLTTVVSPDSGIDAPRFIGNNAAIPPVDTAVRVRIVPGTPALGTRAEPDKKADGVAPAAKSPRP